MLRASAEVLRPGGLTAFLTIHPAPGLSPADLEAAIAAGPPVVAMRGELGGLLAEAGFLDIAVRDVTDEYRRTQQAWHDQWQANAAALADQLGADAVAEKRQRRLRALAGIDAGLLVRSLVSGRRQ